MATDLGRRRCGVRATNSALRVFGVCVYPGASAFFARVACTHKRGVRMHGCVCGLEGCGHVCAGGM